VGYKSSPKTRERLLLEEVAVCARVALRVLARVEFRVVRTRRKTIVGLGRKMFDLRILNFLSNFLRK
jgi:hypothetical protein